MLTNLLSLFKFLELTITLLLQVYHLSNTKATLKDSVQLSFLGLSNLLNQSEGFKCNLKAWFISKITDWACACTAYPVLTNEHN